MGKGRTLRKQANRAAKEAKYAPRIAEFEKAKATAMGKGPIQPRAEARARALSIAADLNKVAVKVDTTGLY